MLFGVLFSVAVPVQSEEEDTIDLTSFLAGREKRNNRLTRKQQIAAPTNRPTLWAMPGAWGLASCEKCSPKWFRNCMFAALLYTAVETIHTPARQSAYLFCVEIFALDFVLVWAILEPIQTGS